MNDDAEPWKWPTPFLEVLSEQEVQYLAPTMAKVAAYGRGGRREGRENSVEISPPMQMLCNTALATRAC